MLNDRSLLHDPPILAVDNDLDLRMVSLKLMDPDEGLGVQDGWSVSYCERAVQEYRRFLALTRAYPQLMLVPSHAVDKVWHTHILDTRAYAQDCQRIFGYFLHHYPYLGMRGAADQVAHLAAMGKTLELYRKHFGEPSEDLWGAAALRPPKCGAPSYLPA